MPSPRLDISPADITACLRRDQGHLRALLRRVAERKRQGKPVDKLLEQLGRELDAAKQRADQRWQQRPRATFPEELPINRERETIVKAIREHQVVVICGETGSGKSTQLPKICLDMGRGRSGAIGQTQPRRIAARSVANRIAEELGTSVGQGVGYKVRFTDRAGALPFIKVMTDGILLAETQGDRSLDQYDTLIIDEAHERSLNIDFLLGYLHRLLPQRPDLKVIITSATIDPQRFSEHFGDAPIIEVSGRMYPVEVRYRPYGEDIEDDEEDDDERDQEQAIVDAVDELARVNRNDPGDVLVFLSGEREIRRAAEALRKHHPPGVEILPLFARLSADEQMRVFKPHKQRRIVLATNVAETSLTVPGIRYVVDTGKARISRYAARAKVQRLPVEKIAQASANQRKGRCGRMSSGVCIRLYSEADFDSREAFTPPEIQRTNLASVILQMKALGLGAVDDFPFIDPPRPEMVRDGYHTLHEIGAIDDENELTDLGRELSHLPIDPRIARMVMAGMEFGCGEEVLIIAAALSVQDARERPHDKQEAADAAHAKFEHEDSDFLTFLNLWDFYHEQSRKLSHSKLRKACRQNFLSYVRLREWHDTQRQLKELIAERGLARGLRGKSRRGRDKRDANATSRSKATDAIAPGSRDFDNADNIHRALLTGLLSNIGCRGDGYEYTGAGGIKFHIHPSSVHFDTKPKWLMAAELVETTRLFARTVARIQPAWIEPLAPHLVKKTYSEPRWQERTAHVVADEQVSLYGLVLVPQRLAHFGPVDPARAREIFIHHAFVMGEYQTAAPFFAHNRRLQERIETIEAKGRRHDVLADELRRFAFYDERIPRGIHNGPLFETWRKQAERENPKLLFMSEADLMAADPSDVTDARYPNELPVGEASLPLEYHYDGNSEIDGVTVRLPIESFNQLTARRLDWLVPGMLPEKLTELIRLLPKDWRRNFVPAPDYAKACCDAMPFAQGDLLEALSRELENMTQVRVPREAWNIDALPRHLRMNVTVVDAKGTELATSRDLGAIREQLGDRLQTVFADIAKRRYNKRGITAWDFGTLEPRVELEQEGVKIVGYPALVERDGSLSLELLDSPAAARQASRRGIRRLCIMQMTHELNHQRRSITNRDRLAMQWKALQRSETLDEQLVELIADRAFLGDDDLPRDAEQFERCLDVGWHRMDDVRVQVAAIVGDILDARLALERATPDDPPEAWRNALADMRYQLSVLFPLRFLVDTPFPWLRQYPRFLTACSKRIDKLRRLGPQRDRDLMNPILPHCHRFYQTRKKQQAQGIVDIELESLKWMIEEYRVHQFAQELGNALPVSEKRLNDQWAKVKT